MVLGVLVAIPAAFATWLRVLPPSSDELAKVASFIPYGLVMWVPAMVLLGKTEAQKRRRNRSRRFYLEVQDVEHVQPLVDIPNIDRVQIVAARSGLPEQVGLYITLGPKRDPAGDAAFRETLLGFAGVAFVMPDTDDF